MMAKLNTAALMGAAALAMGASACVKADHAPNDPGAVKAAIKADEKNWIDEFKNRNFEALAGHYADDAFFASSAGAPASGSTEIRKMFANGLTDKNFQVTFESDKMDVAASGDLAYSRGHFTEQFSDAKTGEIVSESGSYVEIYKKQAGGGWKMVEDFAVSDPATRKVVPPAKPATRARMVSS